MDVFPLIAIKLSCFTIHFSIMLQTLKLNNQNQKTKFGRIDSNWTPFVAYSITNSGNQPQMVCEEYKGVHQLIQTRENTSVTTRELLLLWVREQIMWEPLTNKTLFRRLVNYNSLFLKVWRFSVGSKPSTATNRTRPTRRSSTAWSAATRTESSQSRPPVKRPFLFSGKPWTTMEENEHSTLPSRLRYVNLYLFYLKFCHFKFPICAYLQLIPVLEVLML